MKYSLEGRYYLEKNYYPSRISLDKIGAKKLEDKYKSGNIIDRFNYVYYMWSSCEGGDLDFSVIQSKMYQFLDEYFAPAYYIIGMNFINSKKSQSQVEYGIRLLHKASSLGNDYAKYELGHALTFGTFVEQDLNKAIQILQKNKLFLAKSNYLIGYIYHKLLNGKNDHALLYYTASKTAEGHNKIGDLYNNRDLKYLAYIHYKKAATQGNTEANYSLAQIYLRDDSYFVKQDFNLGLKYLYKAVQDNYQPAVYQYVELMKPFYMHGLSSPDSIFQRLERIILLDNKYATDLYLDLCIDLKLHTNYQFLITNAEKINAALYGVYKVFSLGLLGVNVDHKLAAECAKRLLNDYRYNKIKDVLERSIKIYEGIEVINGSIPPVESSYSSSGLLLRIV